MNLEIIGLTEVIHLVISWIEIFDDNRFEKVF